MQILNLKLQIEGEGKLEGYCLDVNCHCDLDMRRDVMMRMTQPEMAKSEQSWRVCEKVSQVACAPEPVNVAKSMRLPVNARRPMRL